MNYSINFPNNCGCNNQGVFSSNTWNHSPASNCGHPQACQGCLDIIKCECIIYTGSNLTSTGINKYDDLCTILTKLDAIKAIQDTKNTNILAALNDINDRLNVLEDASHAPYTLL